jgi:hypothetical protein
MNNEIIETFKGLTAVTDIKEIGSGMYEVKALSMFSSKENTMCLSLDIDQLSRYNNGALIQDAFPHLTASEREFLKSGNSEEEWDCIFKEVGFRLDQ